MTSVEGHFTTKNSLRDFHDFGNTKKIDRDFGIWCKYVPQSASLDSLLQDVKDFVITHAYFPHLYVYIE